MDEKQYYELKDPKLPAVNGSSPGNGMENRRRTSPLPENLVQAGAERNLSI